MKIPERKSSGAPEGRETRVKEVFERMQAFIEKVRLHMGERWQNETMTWREVGTFAQGDLFLEWCEIDQEWQELHAQMEKKEKDGDPGSES